MTENIYLKKVPCAGCSKLIDSKADFCSFCGASQKGVKRVDEKKELPGQVQLLVLNFICPGLGNWKLGEKLRGTIFLLIVVGALLGYANDILPGIRMGMQQLIDSGDITAMESIKGKVASSGWIYIFVIGYILSFVDTFFLLENKRKKLEERKNELSS